MDREERRMAPRLQAHGMQQTEVPCVEREKSKALPGSQTAMRRK